MEDLKKSLQNSYKKKHNAEFPGISYIKFHAEIRYGFRIFTHAWIWYLYIIYSTKGEKNKSKMELIPHIQWNSFMVPFPITQACKTKFSHPHPYGRLGKLSLAYGSLVYKGKIACICACACTRARTRTHTYMHVNVCIFITWRIQINKWPNTQNVSSFWCSLSLLSYDLSVKKVWERDFRKQKRLLGESFDKMGFLRI